MPQPLSAGRRALFALGNAGWQFSDRIVMLMAVYFYLPPGGRGLDVQVPVEPLAGFATVYGLAMFAGRIFDTAADPVVGHASDRSRARWGRRRVFMLAGLLPMVAAPILVFFPPAPPGSAWNGLWAGGLFALYFVAFTVYLVPYLALIPELAWDQRERVRLSQAMQLAGIPVLALFSAWGLGLDWGRAAGLEPARAMQLLVIGLSLLGLLFALAPILAVDERRHTRAAAAELSFRQALAATLRNRPFLLYLLAQLFFIVSINLVQPAFPYLATVVLGRSEGYMGWFVLSAGAGIGVGFAFQRALVARFGPKRVMMGSVAVMALGLAGLGLLAPSAPGGAGDARNLWICHAALFVFGIAVAGALVLPHVLISQLIDADTRRTGSGRAAMFFGVQGLMTKWMYGVSTALFTFLLARFGASTAEPLGVLLVGPVSAVLGAVAFALYALYPERDVLGAGAGD